MNTQLQNVSKVWPSIKAVFSVPHSEKEYQSLVKTIDTLIDEVGDNENHELSPVMETIGKLIENDEEQNCTFSESSALDTLKYLMKEHDLKQSDLKETG